MISPLIYANRKLFKIGQLSECKCSFTYRGVKVSMSWPIAAVVGVRHSSVTSMMLRILVKHDGIEIMRAAGSIWSAVNPLAGDGDQQGIYKRGFAGVVWADDEDIQRIY